MALPAKRAGGPRPVAPVRILARVQGRPRVPFVAAWQDERKRDWWRAAAGRSSEKLAQSESASSERA
eukprot:8291188-Pyramimonas_sp.AAC.1